MNHRLKNLAVVGLVWLLGAGAANAGPTTCGSVEATLTIANVERTLACGSGASFVFSGTSGFTLSASVSSSMVELGMFTGGTGSIGGAPAIWDFGLPVLETFDATLSKESDTFLFAGSPSGGATSLTKLSGGDAEFTILDGPYGAGSTFTAIYKSDEQQVPEPGTIQLALLSLGLLWGLGRRRTAPGTAAA